MANGGEKNNDFYAVLGLKKECTAAELKNSYKKLALIWHPDRCSSSGNSKSVEEAKKKFQAIQQAYSVLSDSNKRLLYDVGVYDSNDDDENGMGDFLNEMAVMMSQTKSNKNGQETFEELKDLFDEMFPGDLETYGASSHARGCCSTSSLYASQCSSSSSSSNNKRSSTEMNYWKINGNGMESSDCDALFQNYPVGVVEQMQDHLGKENVIRGGIQGGASRSSRRYGRKQKVTSGQDVSSNDYSGISAT